jgi:hypothetical protein
MGKIPGLLMTELCNPPILKYALPLRVSFGEKMDSFLFKPL